MSFWMQLARKVARASTHKQHKMGAVIFRGGAVLSTAANGDRTGRHAELRATVRDLDFTGAGIAIARLNGLRLSRPCRSCFLTIRDAGIKEMHFIDERGYLVVKKVAAEKETTYRDYHRQRR